MVTLDWLIIINEIKLDVAAAKYGIAVDFQNAKFPFIQSGDIDQEGAAAGKSAVDRERAWGIAQAL